MKLSQMPEPAPPKPGFKLDPHQVEGSAFLAEAGRAYLGDPPGVGKTPQAVEAIRHLRPTTTLIIAPGVAWATWKRNLNDWLGISPLFFPEDIGPFKGKRVNPNKRTRLEAGDVVITNLQQLHKIKRWVKSWELIIIDEAHEFRNRKAIRFKDDLKKIKSLYFFALSGSPQVNELGDMWPLLNYIDPMKWSSYWQFVMRHCFVEEEIIGKLSTGQLRTAKRYYGVKNPAALQAEIGGVFLRREKSILNLPPKIRQPLYVGLTAAQEKLYDEIAEEMYTEWEGGFTEINEEGLIMAPNSLARDVRLRQTLITPALYGAPHTSGAIDAVAEQISLDFDAGLNVMVFTPFAKAFPFIEEAIRNKAKPTAVYTYRSKASPQEKALLEDIFCDESQQRIAALTTVKAATSFTASAMSVAYFLGYEWSPTFNEQAEDRMWRRGQKKNVLCRYVVHEGTIDEHVLDVLEGKTKWEQLALTPSKMLRPFLKR